MSRSSSSSSSSRCHPSLYPTKLSEVSDSSKPTCHACPTMGSTYFILVGVPSSTYICTTSVRALSTWVLARRTLMNRHCTLCSSLRVGGSTSGAAGSGTGISWRHTGQKMSSGRSFFFFSSVGGADASTVTPGSPSSSSAKRAFLPLFFLRSGASPSSSRFRAVVASDAVPSSLTTSTGFFFFFFTPDSVRELSISNRPRWRLLVRRCDGGRGGSPGGPPLAGVPVLLTVLIEALGDRLPLPSIAEPWLACNASGVGTAAGFVLWCSEFSVGWWPRSAAYASAALVVAVAAGPGPSGSDA
mmetsp:Transcript_19264/g.59850  ORF Transcript_19264/g.59850 Transcript_19264/m.59850 type:complete len:300 (+) Transcript_19264:980-1879(+)